MQRRSRDFTVGIFGGEEPPVSRRHVAPHVVEDTAGDSFEKRLARDLKCFEISHGQLRLVIKHFFEMRHVPVGIDRVTVKSAADVIVHSARRHFAQGEQIHLERVLAPRGLRFTRVHPSEEVERDRPRKFRRDTEAAFVCVVAARDLLICRFQRRRPQLHRRSPASRFRLSQRGDDLRPLLRDSVVVLLPRERDSLEDFRESGLAIAVRGREISATDKRLQLRREPDAHGPTAAAGRRLDEGHVNAINIRPFFAVDFDVHKLPVHDRGHIGVFERFVRHDMTPMAGRITDREKDRLVFLARFRERFFAPRKPIDRIAGVLEKVRRLLAT